MRYYDLTHKDYRLTTALILYHIPDYPKLLQSYIWQEIDILPDFPVLKKFVEFWELNLDGKIHSLKVESCSILEPVDKIRHVNGIITVH